MAAQWKLISVHIKTRPVSNSFLEALSIQQFPTSVLFFTDYNLAKIPAYLKHYLSIQSSQFEILVLFLQLVRGYLLKVWPQAGNQNLVKMHGGYEQAFHCHHTQTSYHTGGLQLQILYIITALDYKNFLYHPND